MAQKRILVLSATGSGKKRTIPSLVSSQEAIVVAAQGRSEGKLKELKESYPDISIFEKEQEALELVDCDIVYIASPPFMHKQQILDSVNRGRAVICEKPLTISFAEANDIAEAIKSKNVPFMLAHHLRHQKVAREVKQLVQNQDLGSTKNAFFQWNFPVSIASPSSKWKFDPENNISHSFYDAGIHAIDLSVFLWGAPEKVYATGFDFIGKGTFDSVTCVLKYRAHTVMLACSQTQSTLGNDLNIYLEKGKLFIKDFFSEKSANNLLIESTEGIEERTYQNINLYGAEVESFAQMLNGRNSTYVGTTIDEALLSMRILDCITDSLQSGQPCEIKDDEGIA